MLHVKQQHAGGVGVIAGVDARELVGQVVLREHDLCDLFEVLRLVFAHPEELRGGEAREGNVGRQRGQLVFADDVIEIVDFFGRAPIVPQNRWTDDVVGFIQRDKAVHLPAGADACNFTCVKAAQQLGNTGHNCAPPVLGLLLRPAGVWEDEGVLVRDLGHDRAGLVDAESVINIRHRGCDHMGDGDLLAGNRFLNDSFQFLRHSFCITPRSYPYRLFSV